MSSRKDLIKLGLRCNLAVANAYQAACNIAGPLASPRIVLGTGRQQNEAEVRIPIMPTSFSKEAISSTSTTKHHPHQH